MGCDGERKGRKEGLEIDGCCWRRMRRESEMYVGGRLEVGWCVVDWR